MSDCRQNLFQPCKKTQSYYITEKDINSLITLSPTLTNVCSRYTETHRVDFFF